MKEHCEDLEEDEPESELDELRERIDALENYRGSGGIDPTIPYLSGVALAMILSWSKYASILWCMAHGFLSWAYVIYFAFAR